MTLSHLTLNTGDLRLSPREEVIQAVIAALKPIIAAEGGPIPAMDGWFLDFLFPLDEDGNKRPGAAYFQIADEPGTSKRPVVIAIACWDEKISETAWAEALAAYEALKRPLQATKLWRNPPARPAAPWLAVCLTPFLVTADQDTIGMFGDLERCVAYALIEGNQGETA